MPGASKQKTENRSQIESVLGQLVFAIWLLPSDLCHLKPDWDWQLNKRIA